jgi:hypothetical protein
MNDDPIGFTTDADLSGSWPAMQRAAQRARKLARDTNTCLVVADADADGAVTRIPADQFDRIEAAWAAEAERRPQAHRITTDAPAKASPPPAESE